MAYKCQPENVCITPQETNVPYVVLYKISLNAFFYFLIISLSAHGESLDLIADRGSTQRILPKGVLHQQHVV